MYKNYWLTPTSERYHFQNQDESRTVLEQALRSIFDYNYNIKRKAAYKTFD